MKSLTQFITEYNELVEDAEVEQLDEVTAKRKVVIRKGKKKILWKCPPAHVKTGKRSCKKASGAVRTKRRKSARKSARKRKATRATSTRRRNKSMRRRKSMGLSKRKKKK